jgi:hypothetical protein
MFRNIPLEAQPVEKELCSLWVVELVLARTSQAQSVFLLLGVVSTPCVAVPVAGQRME